MRKSITFIELIIVLCVIVVSVRMWTQHKEPEAKTAGHTSRPTVTIPTVHSNAFCPKCGGNIVVCKDYAVNINAGLGIITARTCEKCNWHIYTCPQCGSNDFIETPAFNTEGKPGMPKPWTPSYVQCKKCGWGK